MVKVRKRLDSISRVLGAEPGHPLKAVLYNNSKEAAQAFPRISEAATREHLFAGFAFPNYRLFLLVGLNPDDMAHELSHLVLGQAVSSPLARVPAWLNEGLATYFEGYSHGREATVAEAARKDHLLRLNSMNTVPGRPQDVRLFYAQAWSIVTYMIDNYGEERMTRFLTQLNKGHNIGGAVEETYGMALTEIEDAWKTKVLETPPVLTARELSAFLLVGALVAFFVLAISAWAYRRVRGGPPGGGPGLLDS